MPKETLLIAESERRGVQWYLQSDTFRKTGVRHWFQVCKGALLTRTLRPVLTLRLCQALAGAPIILRWALPLMLLVHRFATHLAAMDFPWRTQVGAGLCITHGWGLVVSEGARIGRNVTLFHGVTLGRKDRIAPDGSRVIGYPIIEDDVWIGPHAVIVGGVTVGRGSRIAAGVFLTESVAPYSLVVGNPASVVKCPCEPDVMNPVVD